MRPAAPPGSAGPARHIVKIVGHVTATLATTPAVGGAPTSIAPGQVVTFEATSDFRLTSTAPLLVASFVESASQFGGGSSAGDPSQSFVVPISQAQSRVDFIAPAVHAPATALVVAPNGATVTMDGTPVAGWSAIGATGFSFAHVALGTAADAHTAIGSAPFTLTVNAYPTGSATSYSYPGGFTVPTLIFADGFEGP